MCKRTQRELGGRGHAQRVAGWGGFPPKSCSPCADKSAATRREYSSWREWSTPLPPSCPRATRLCAGNPGHIAVLDDLGGKGGGRGRALHRSTGQRGAFRQIWGRQARYGSAGPPPPGRRVSASSSDGSWRATTAGPLAPGGGSGSSGSRCHGCLEAADHPLTGWRPSSCGPPKSAHDLQLRLVGWACRLGPWRIRCRTAVRQVEWHLVFARNPSLSVGPRTPVPVISAFLPPPPLSIPPLFLDS